MKILVIGSGGREHALCHTFERQGHRAICLPGNPGTACPGKQVDLSSMDRIADFAESEGFDMTVAGPEAYLAKGIKDVFSSRGLTLFGPRKDGCKLESSKKFAKEFMKRHHIPTASFTLSKTAEEAHRALDRVFDKWGGVVLKPDGLTAGKGVLVCKTRSAAEEAVKVLLEEKRYGSSCSEVIIEELLQGPECSLLAFCDGSEMKAMIPSQDHKRLLENDAGPNTGGIGAYAPVPFVSETILEEIDEKIIKPTNEGLKSEEIIYQGVLYFGLMLTNDGPKVLEYNCRFGDPEAQAILPLLKSDLAEIMLACCKGTLSQIDIRWKPEYSCVVVMCSGGYPCAFHEGYPIDNAEKFSEDDSIIVFHAGTKRDKKGNLVTSGGRVLSIAGLGHSLHEAVEKAYQGIGRVSFTDAHFRRDIAAKAIKFKEREPYVRDHCYN